MVIIDPEIAEEEIPQAMEKLTRLVAKGNGNVIATDYWGRRKLAYPIEHRGEGNYVLMQLEFDPQGTGEVEAGLNLAEEFLRHLLIRLDD